MDFKAKYNRSEYIDFFRDYLLPEDFEIQEQEIELDFNSKYFADNGVIYIGKSDKLDLAVYEVSHSSENDARVGLSRDAFKLISRYYENNALILFVPKTNDNYRLSLVTIDHKLDKNGTRVLKEYSNPKRYSYFLGDGAKTHTPEQYLIGLGRIRDIEDLKKRFSVEVVNKDFYNKIAEMFSKLVGGKRKRGVKTLNYEPQLKLYNYSIETHEKKYKEFAVRLIGRTVFCWFLKKKKSANNIPLIPEDILSQFAVNMHPDYYHSRVEPLFFEVLNTSVDKRKAEYKQSPYNTIPFLNGGLFEPHTDDFYRAGKPEYGVIVPDSWWKEFIDILEIYNFTIDENTSIDIDLSVDPEMLGRIFENLLAEINPETGETARKATGSYYTPRPIVEYMVDESLKQHIITKSLLPEDKIAPLLDYSIENSGLSPEEENKVKEALNSIKVLDPACGSGAFPMGVLQKMLLILQKVDHSAENSIRNILKDIKDPVYRKLFEAKLLEDDDLDDYARKLNIIRHSIYGIDIQPIATEISKLRFFLSLIVDEKVQDDQKNRGIEPLPNLEFKFACSNTLIPLPENRELFENADAIEALEKLREDYFISFGEEKKSIKKQFEDLQKKMFTENINLFNRDIGGHNLNEQTQSSMLATWNPFLDDSTQWFDAKWMFGVKDGFDVVIGNPPWGADSAKSDIIKKRNKDIIVRMVDSFMFFINESFRLSTNEGNVCFIVPDVVLYQNDNQKLREKILTKYCLNSAINLGDGIFNEVTRASCILIINKLKETNKARIGSFKNGNKIDSKNIPHVDSNQFLLLPNFLFPTENLDGYKLYFKIIGEKLVDYIDADGIQRGVSPDLKDAFIVDETIVRNKSLETDKIKNTITGGHEIKKFHVIDLGKKVIYTTRNEDVDKIPNIVQFVSEYKDRITCKEVKQNKHPIYALHRPREEKIFNKKEKIVGVITADRIIVAIDNKKLYPTDGVYLFGANSKKISNKLLVSILNSKLSTYIYRLMTLEQGRILAQVKPKVLEQLPVKTPDNPSPFENLVDFIQYLKINETPINEYVPNSHIAETFEEIIDAMVFELYFPDEFRKAGVHFIKYAERDFQSIVEKSPEEQKEIIHSTYQLLREKDNEIRSNLHLMDVRLTDLIMPIKSTI